MLHEIERLKTAFPQGGLILVTSRSPLAYRKAVETVALFFQREMGARAITSSTVRESMVTPLF
jgi:hypothetical protein